MLRLLADMENLRHRTSRQIEDSKKFAIQVPRGAPRVGCDWGKAWGWMQWNSPTSLPPTSNVVQKFAKELLDVADNMERALQHVSEEVKTKAGPKEGADYFAQLSSLSDGISMVEKSLQGTLGANGIVRDDPMGKKFDPNTMNALSQVPDPSVRQPRVSIGPRMFGLRTVLHATLPPHIPHLDSNRLRNARSGAAIPCACIPDLSRCGLIVSFTRFVQKREQEVMAVIKMGYSLSGRVIRPAEVIVATGGQSDWAEE